MTEFYPHLDDREFQKKISLKKEFRYKYDGEIVSVKEKSKTLCKRTSAFELSPHQEFVRKFISYQKPKFEYESEEVNVKCAQARKEMVG